MVKVAMQTHTIDSSTKWSIPSFSHLYAFVQYGGQGTLYRLSVPRSGYLDCRVSSAGLCIEYKGLRLVSCGSAGRALEVDQTEYKAAKQQRRRSLQLLARCDTDCPCHHCKTCRNALESNLAKPLVKPNHPNAFAALLSHAAYEAPRGLASEAPRGLASESERGLIPSATVIPRPLFVPSISFLNTARPEVAALQAVFDAMTDLRSPIILIVE